MAGCKKNTDLRTKLKKIKTEKFLDDWNACQQKCKEEPDCSFFRFKVINKQFLSLHRTNSKYS